MYRSLFPFRRLMATSLLLVFVNVFVGQCWCATLQPAPAQPVAKAPAPAQPSHPGCPGHGPQMATPEPVKARHEAKSEKHSDKPDCCKDSSAAILKSLTTPGEKHPEAPAPALLPASNDFFFYPAAGQWARSQAVVLVPREHLPPKIPDIRIFIQSLTV